MDVSDIFKEVFNYIMEEHNRKSIIIIAVLCFVSTFLSNIDNGNGSLISLLLVLIITILIYGIGISIIESTLKNSNEIPKLDLKNNFLDGLRNYILTMVYALVPIIITIIIAIPLGLYSNFYKVALVAEKYPVGTSADVIMQALPRDVVMSLGIAFVVCMLIAVVLLIISMYFNYIAQARLAETGSIMEGLNIKELYNKIKSIGVGKYTIFFIILGILSNIITFIGVFIDAYITIHIMALIYNTVTFLLMYRGIGLIYMEG